MSDDKIPPFPTGATNADGGKTMMLPKSDLLSRIGNFLPQLQAANKDLEEVANKDSLRVDLEMKSDNDDDDNENSDDDDDDDDDKKQAADDDEHDFLIRPAKESKADIDSSISNEPLETANGEEANPTIELKISLGDFGGSPVLDLLGGSSAADEGSDSPKRFSDVESNKDDDDDDGNGDNESGKMSLVASNLLLSGDRKQDKQTKKRQPKGPLITEM